MSTAAFASPARKPVKVTYFPVGSARAFIAARDPEVLIEGPAGTGKTYAAMQKLHLTARKYPKARILMVRQTLESLKTGALNTYIKHVRPELDGVVAFGGSKFYPAEFRYSNGSVIIVGGLDKADKFMSAEYDICFINEATEVSEDTWQALKTRLRNGVVPYQQLLADCNPAGPRHWLNQRCNAGMTRRIKSTHKDNPAYWDVKRNDWTPQGREYVEATLGGLTGVRRQRLLAGVWAATEGQVYTEFDPERHVRKTVRYPESGVVAADEFDVTYCTPYMTVDIGSRNPTAILTAHVRGFDEHLHISREVYRRGMGSTEILTAITDEADICNPFAIYIDPSAKAYITDLLNMGYPAVAANNDVLVGIQRVHGVLKHGFSIDPECVHTIDEFGEYSYQDNPKIETDKPIKDNDHCLIAGTMVATRRGDMPIEHVPVGTLVLTRGGYRPVIASGMTSPAAEVYTVTLANGKTITGTGNHRIWVDARGGWTRIDDLHAGDVLTGRTEVKVCASKQPFTGGLRSAGIQIHPASLTATTTSRTADTSMREFWHSIEKFGEIITETSRKVITSITSTGIRPTTISPTLNASPRSTISHFTDRNRLPISSANTWRTFGHWLLNGTVLTLAVSGIASMDALRGELVSLSAKTVTSAASRSMTSPAGHRADSAATPASRRGGGHLALMTKNGPAQSVEIPSASTATPPERPARFAVLDITKHRQKQPVFDLTIDGVHEFVANGVLVHNSMDAIRYLCMGVMQDEGDGDDVLDLYR